jgi:hypothetical protein
VFAAEILRLKAGELMEKVTSKIARWLWILASMTQILSLTSCEQNDDKHKNIENSSQMEEQQPHVLGPVPVVPTTNAVRQGSGQGVSSFDLLKSQVTQVFTVFCTECHNPTRQDGQLSNLLDLNALAANKKLVTAGNAEASLMYQKTLPHSSMRSDQTPSLGHREMIRKWIQSLVSNSTQPTLQP